MVHLYNRIIFSNPPKTKLLVNATTWMNCTDVMLSEKSQSQRSERSISLAASKRQNYRDKTHQLSSAAACGGRRCHKESFDGEELVEMFYTLIIEVVTWIHTYVFKLIGLLTGKGQFYSLMLFLKPCIFNNTTINFVSMRVLNQNLLDIR